MTRPKIRTTILTLITALVIAAVAAPLASAAVVPNGNVLGDAPTISDGYTPETQIWGMLPPQFSATHSNASSTNLHVQGLVNVTPSGGQVIQSLIQKGYRFEIRIWGDDPSSDDLLLGPFRPQMLYMFDQSFNAGGLGYVLDANNIPNRWLDEDNSRFDDQDEIYAGIRLLDPSGKTIRSIETKRLIFNY